MRNRFTGKFFLQIYFSIILFSPFTVLAQDTVKLHTYTAALPNDTSAYLFSQPLNSKTYDLYTRKTRNRIKLMAAANVVGYGGAMAGLYSDWYSNYPQTHFHFFNDNHEWKQVDKVGHAYSAYVESSGSMELWRWTGMKRRQRIWIGGLSGIAYQTVIETLDGFSSQWGWSWGDFGANVFGSGLLISQELLWDKQKIHMKFSTHKKNYNAADLNNRADKLYGKTFGERLVKDYNAQTYWLSANLKDFMPESNLPSWLNVAFGYGAEGMFGANANIGTDDHGNINFDRRDITRYRQFYISPDIDLTKIKTKRTLVRLALVALNSFKFPAPSLEYNSKGKFAFHFIHF